MIQCAVLGLLHCQARGQSIKSWLRWPHFDRVKCKNTHVTCIECMLRKPRWSTLIRNPRYGVLHNHILVLASRTLDFLDFFSRAYPVTASVVVMCIVVPMLCRHCHSVRCSGREIAIIISLSVSAEHYLQSITCSNQIISSRWLFTVLDVSCCKVNRSCKF